jgi:peptide deformylase
MPADQDIGAGMRGAIVDMGQVIAFEKASAALLAGQPSEISRLKDTLLSLSQDMRGVDVTAASIGQDLRVILTVLESTADLDLRARLLNDIKAIRFQLQLVSLVLRRTRDSIEQRDA